MAPEFFAWHDFVGYAGVGLIVIAYFALQTGRMKGEAIGFSAMNAVGAALILVSLTQTFNAASFVIEIFWLAISLIGLARAFSRR
ncbi:MAG: hypothetical protein Tsb0010_14840 [Parvularculaceae bacterium]